MRMRDAIRSAALGALALLAIAVAAATLDSTAATGPSAPSGAGSAPGSGPGPGSGSGPGSGVGGGLPPASSAVTPGEVVQVPAVVGALLFLALLVAGLALVGYALLDWRRTVALAVGGVGFLLLLFALSQLLPAFARTLPPALVPGGGGAGSTEPTPAAPPPVAVLLVVGLAVVAVAAAVGRGAGPAEANAVADEGDERDDRSPGDGRAAAVGRAAGRAADRIEAGSEVDNEVYRAWRELTGLVEMSDPATRTPGEFAEAAVTAGLGREDVAELTRLFEAVRYGEASPTEADERRAVAVFRRIEARYAGTEPDDSTEVES